MQKCGQLISLIAYHVKGEVGDRDLTEEEVKTEGGPSSSSTLSLYSIGGGSRIGLAMVVSDSVGSISGSSMITSSSSSGEGSWDGGDGRYARMEGVGSISSSSSAPASCAAPPHLRQP